MSIDQSIELRPIQQAESPDLGVRDEAQILQFNQRICQLGDGQSQQLCHRISNRGGRAGSLTLIKTCEPLLS